MAENTKIEWADHTFNPWIGCTKVSEGCKYCYAEALMDDRFGRKAWGFYGTREPTSQANWYKVRRWDRAAAKRDKPARVFCGSLCDVFEGRETVESQQYQSILAARSALWTLIGNTPNLIWMLLTKRPGNVMEFVPEEWKQHWPKHVWIGASVEDQKTAEERIPLLAKIPARTRFLSIEPLLGPIRLLQCVAPDWDAFEDATCGQEGWDEPEEFIEECEEECDWINYGHELVESSEHKEWAYDRERYARFLALQRSVQWIIVGGESGPHARPMNPEWVCDIERDRRLWDDSIAFFFKQWGGVDKKASGRTLYGRTYDELPVMEESK